VNTATKFTQREFIKILYSMLEVKILITGLAVLFLIFVVVMTGII